MTKQPALGERLPAALDLLRFSSHPAVVAIMRRFRALPVESRKEREAYLTAAEVCHGVSTLAKRSRRLRGLGVQDQPELMKYLVADVALRNVDPADGETVVVAVAFKGKLLSRSTPEPEQAVSYARSLNFPKSQTVLVQRMGNRRYVVSLKDMMPIVAASDGQVEQGVSTSLMDPQQQSDAVLF